MNLAIILAAINAVGPAIPEFVQLIDILKDGFSAKDQAEINQALARASAMADDQHREAQLL